MKLQHEVWIHGKPEVVHKAISRAQGFAQWWTTNVKGTCKQGESLRFGFNGGQYWMQFDVQKVQDNQVVLQCIEADEHSQDWIDTTLQFKLSEQEQITRLQLTHRGWKEDADSFARVNTTWGLLLFSLKSYIETGQGQPMQ